MPDLIFSPTPTDAVAEDALQLFLENHERGIHKRVHLHKTTLPSARQDLNSFEAAFLDGCLQRGGRLSFWSIANYPQPRAVEAEISRFQLRGLYWRALGHARRKDSVVIYKLRSLTSNPL